MARKAKFSQPGLKRNNCFSCFLPALGNSAFQLLLVYYWHGSPTGLGMLLHGGLLFMTRDGWRKGAWHFIS